MLPSTSDFIVNLAEADMKKRIPISKKLLAFRNDFFVPYGDYQLEIHSGLFLRFLVQEDQLFLKLLKSSAKCAFGILKARWRCLLNGLDHNIENIPDVIISCCVLHNMCQMKGDSYIDNDDVLEHTLQREWDKAQRREEREFYASAIRYGAL